MKRGARWTRVKHVAIASMVYMLHDHDSLDPATHVTLIAPTPVFAPRPQALAGRAIRGLDGAGRPDVGLLHHADQGSPYASRDCQTILAALGITCSITRRGNCYDNAPWGVFAKLDGEERAAGSLRQLAATRDGVVDYLEVFYNRRRRHSTLGQIRPAAFERRR